MTKTALTKKEINAFLKKIQDLLDINDLAIKKKVPFKLFVGPLTAFNGFTDTLSNAHYDGTVQVNIMFLVEYLLYNEQSLYYAYAHDNKEHQKWRRYTRQQVFKEIKIYLNENS